MWKDHVATLSEKASKSLANPEEYKNLFPNYDQSLLEEAERHGLGADAPSNCASVRLREPQSDGQFSVSKNGASKHAVKLSFMSDTWRRKFCT